MRWVLAFALLASVLVCWADDSPKGEPHEFQAEVRKMLEIIIHSLYTNRNIFLREIISNGSDALDKIRFSYLTEPKDPKTESGESPSMDIRVKVDKDLRQLVVQDGGIGMTKEDLITNLGSLGTSGTKRFLEKVAEGSADMNMIGQFGVGFYSVFLVADNVKVASKHDNEDKQWVWESTADGNFFVYEDPRGNTLGRGTELTLDLKKDGDDYLDTDKIQEIVGRYSEFIHFPIYVQTSKTEKVPKAKDETETADEEKSDEEKKDDDDSEVKDDDDDEEKDKKEEEMEEVTTYDWKLINENKPIWTRKPSDIKEDEYNSFFKAITKESEDPLWYTHFNAEGEVEFKSILYIPGKAPFNLFDHTQGSMTNIRLYVRRVFITDEFKDLLPRYLNFIRGVVDSDDLPLNVSRELLQENRILKIIKKKLIRKTLTMFKDIADADEKGEDDDDEKDDAEVAKDEEKKEDEDKEKDEEKDDDDEDKDKKADAKYPKFWQEFGKNIRLGLIEDSTNRARLTKLLRYSSSKSGDSVTSFEEYIERMGENQKNIYFLIGESTEKIKESPMLEQAKEKDIEVLYMNDPIDEYVVGHITEFSGKKLVSLAKGDVKFEDESDRQKKVDTKRKEAWEPFTKWLKDTLGEKIEKATLSKRVVNTPCVLVSPQYGLTANMERIMKGQALADTSQSGQTAKRIMEINHRHPVVDELRRRFTENADDETAKDMAVLMYEVAALQSGFALDDNNDFAGRMYKFMKQGLNVAQDAGLVEEEEYAVDDDEDEKDEDDDDEKDEDDEKEEEEEEKEPEKEEKKDEL